MGWAAGHEASNEARWGTHTHFSCVSLLRDRLPDGDLPEISVVSIHNTVPGDCIGINVKSRKSLDLFCGEFGRISLINAQLLQSPNLNGRELALAFLLGNKSIE